MQLASPLFAFLFLPLSLLFLPLCPAKHRKGGMLAISLCFFLLTNWQNPWAFAQIGFIVLLLCLLSCLRGEKHPRVRLALGILLPLTLLISARVLAEVIPARYTYPVGLGLVCLGGISLSIDRYRGDAPERDTPVAVASYLLLFPTLLMGPILRYKQYLHITEGQAPGFPAFSRGALLYMIGYIKRIALTTILLSTLQSVLSVAERSTPPLILLPFALFLAFFTLYFAVSGTTDMARGLFCIYGLSPTRGQGHFFSAVTPHRMLGGLILSLDRFLEDYLAAPLRRLPTRTGKCLAALAVTVCTLLFYRTHPAVLLTGAPLLLSALLTATHGRYARRPRAPWLRAPLCVLSALALSFFALSVMLEDPTDIFLLLPSRAGGNDRLSLYRLMVALSHRHYLLLFSLAALIVMPLSRYGSKLLAHLPKRLQSALTLLAVLALFAAFFLTILYLLPQFPQYVELTYRKLLW